MMDDLPEDCILCILSSTTPRDTCQFSATSKWACAKAESDSLWEQFLPSYINKILQILVSPIDFKSKKELFVRLLSPVHVDGGNKLLWLDRSTGKICYMLSARELSITWGSNPIYWSWKPLLDSRFPEVVELITTWWLEIRGKINCNVLSPNTTYKAYLIVKFSKRAYGLDTLLSEVTVELGEQRSYGSVYLRPGDGKPLWENLAGLLKKDSSSLSNYEEKDKTIHKRIDGWFEIEIGEFYNYRNDGAVKMSLKETEGVHLKGGLIINGIEIRPK